jgi:FtsZ-interacting cell division protein YlmF
MVDEIKDAPDSKPTVSNGRAGKKDVNIFPALTDRRGIPMTARQASPSRIGTQISIFCPASFEEALDIVECLRGRAATTISLENLKKLDASRLVDFVAGASAALDGDFHKLSEQVYLFCPSNIKITAPGKPTTGTTSGITGGASALGGLGGLGIAGNVGSSGELDFLYPSTQTGIGLGKSQLGANWPTLQ